MNYYEELGVRPDASVEDIRQAYKMMARLLHPDRQVNPNLQQIADRQMKRLGEIVGLLIDAKTRSHYDSVLLPGNHPPAPYRRRAMLVPATLVPATVESCAWQGGNDLAGLVVRYWFWILMGAFGIALTTWSFLQPNPAVPVRELHGEAWQRDSAFERQPVHHPAKPRSANAGPLLPMRRPVSPASAGAPPGVPGVPDRFFLTPPVIAPPKPVPDDIPPVLFAKPEPLPEVGQSLPAQSLSPLRMEGRIEERMEASFAGRWLYSPKAGDAPERGVYPATYVELHLVERGGEMAGDYHALYRVHDQAVSPEVAFEIRGTAESATSAKFAWVARDHAKGRAEMTLQGPNVLYVTWWTTAFGRQASLGSGTAVLIRQLEP